MVSLEWLNDMSSQQHLEIVSKLPWWNGGISSDRKGYFMINVNGKRVFYHRWVYEQYYKCCILHWVGVHHIDGNTRNNFPNNLKLMPQSKHVTLHNPRKGTGVYDCIVCGVRKNNRGSKCRKCYAREYRKKNEERLRSYSRIFHRKRYHKVKPDSTYYNVLWVKPV